MPAKGYKKSKFNGLMCIELIEMFENGETREQFCARHNLSESTFERWLETYPMFRDAYVAAIPKAKAYYQDLMKNHLVEQHKGPKLNMKAIELIYRNRFNMPHNRLVRLEGMNKRSAQDKLESICNAVEQGTLTADEAQKLASLIDSTIKAAEHDELKQRVEAIERANEVGAGDDEFQES